MRNTTNEKLVFFFHKHTPFHSIHKITMQRPPPKSESQGNLGATLSVPSTTPSSPLRPAKSIGSFLSGVGAGVGIGGATSPSNNLLHSFKSASQVAVGVGVPSPSFLSSPSPSVSYSGSVAGGGFTSSSVGRGDERAWSTVSSKVYSLFNGEGLKGSSIEELNEIVRAVLSRESSAEYIVDDIRLLLEKGLSSLHEFLWRHSETVSEREFVDRLVRIWVVFYSTLLPSVEAIFLPVSSASIVNIRNLALTSFRDHVLFPHIIVKLESSLGVVESTMHLSRILQMILSLMTFTVSQDGLGVGVGLGSSGHVNINSSHNNNNNVHEMKETLERVYQKLMTKSH